MSNPTHNNHIEMSATANIKKTAAATDDKHVINKGELDSGIAGVMGAFSANAQSNQVAINNLGSQITANDNDISSINTDLSGTINGIHPDSAGVLTKVGRDIKLDLVLTSDTISSVNKVTKWSHILFS